MHDACQIEEIEIALRKTQISGRMFVVILTDSQANSRRQEEATIAVRKSYMVITIESFRGRSRQIVVMTNEIEMKPICRSKTFINVGTLSGSFC